MSTEARQVGGSAQDPSWKTMAAWTFDAKFSRDTQLTFGSLTFVAGEDGDMKMLPLGPAPKQLALVSSSTSGDSCSRSNSFAGIYICTAKIAQGILVVISILWPLVGASSLSSSTSTLDPDSFDDYPEVGASVCGEPRKAVTLSAWWP
jgi:hypothetical protein